MKLDIQIQSALANLLSSKMRSFLALLGILVGTASVVAMVSGGQLATMQALKQFEKLGTNLMTVSASYTGQSSNDDNPKSQISLDTAMNMVSASPDILAVAPYTNSFAQLSFGGNQLDGDIIGAEDHLASIMQLSLMKGRFISLLDNYSFYAVLGQDLYNKIQNITPNPIGKQIQVGNQFFTIVGVLNHWDQNSFVYADLNNAIVIPIQTSLLLSKYTKINTIIVKVKPKVAIQPIQDDIKNYVKKNVLHQRLYFNSPEQLVQSMQKQKAIFTIFLGFIGGISLLVGGIGVMNIMLVSVTERRREIGIRLAVGATPSDISWLFLVESIILSLLGGVVGVLLGIFISFVIAEARHWGFAFFLDPPLVGFSVSVFVGIFFGFYPAYKASKLAPIEALRTE